MSNKKKPIKGATIGPIEDPVVENPLHNTTPPSQERSWILSIGFYPGILFGIRKYKETYSDTYVLYLPFVDIALEIDN
jgi:hypothetical protein